MSSLFEPLAIRGLTLRSRIVVSPMCQYSSVDGFANDWHFVHLGGLAVGGAAIVFAEATAVTDEGRISPEDLGLWKDEQIEMLERITRFVGAQGAIPGIQLAHAGRKGSTFRPWSERKGMVPEAEGGWRPVASADAVPGRADYAGGIGPGRGHSGPAEHFPGLVIHRGALARGPIASPFSRLAATLTFVVTGPWQHAPPSCPACAGHPRLGDKARRGWPGRKRAKRRRSSDGYARP